MADLGYIIVLKYSGLSMLLLAAEQANIAHMFRVWRKTTMQEFRSMLCARDAGSLADIYHCSCLIFRC